MDKCWFMTMLDLARGLLFDNSRPFPGSEDSATKELLLKIGKEIQQITGWDTEKTARELAFRLLESDKERARFFSEFGIE